MSERTPYEEYLICQERGHQPSGFVYSSIPPKDRCRWCGTTYWREAPRLMESNQPTPPEEEPK